MTIEPVNLEPLANRIESPDVKELIEELTFDSVAHGVEEFCAAEKEFASLPELLT